MRIVQLTPGSGDQFYCENCLRDAALVRALRAKGADVVLVPMYLPLSLDGDRTLERTDVFFGGINVYLQQKVGLFRRTPRWLDKVFDAGWLLRCVSKKAGMTSARQLGEMTLSMLEGPRGRQGKEVERLIEFLQSPENKPDVLILSNLLLAGMAGPVREKLGCKLVCWLQDEDGFVDGLGEPWSSAVWQEMARIVPLFDLFLPVSHYFAHAIQERLPIGDETIYVCAPGLDMSKYEPAERLPDGPAVGYLGRMCHANGLDFAAQAFSKLVGQDKMAAVKLLICGGMTAADKQLVDKIKESLHSGATAGRVEFLDDFEWSNRLSFLQRLSVLCSPARTAPAYAMNVLEAMACGVPFVAPRTGVYPEWAELTGAGVLYESENPEEPHRSLRALLIDSDRRNELGQKGRRAAMEHFDIRRTAAGLKKRFEDLLKF